MRQKVCQPYQESAVFGCFWCLQRFAFTKGPQLRLTSEAGVLPAAASRLHPAALAGGKASQAPPNMKVAVRHLAHHGTLWVIFVGQFFGLVSFVAFLVIVWFGPTKKAFGG